MLGQGFGNQLVGFGFRLTAYLDGVGVRIRVDLGHIGRGFRIDALTFRLLLGFHGHLGLLNLCLELALGSDLLGLNGIGEGVGEVDVFNAQADDVDAVVLQLRIQAVPDGFTEGLTVGHQIFRGVFAENAFGDLQHPGVDQLVEVVRADFPEQGHGSRLIDSIVDAAGDIHLLDVAGESFGGEAGFLLPVIHGDDPLEGALEMQTGFHGPVLHAAEGGDDTGITGFNCRRAGGGDQGGNHQHADDDDQTLFHGRIPLFQWFVVIPAGAHSPAVRLLCHRAGKKYRKGTEKYNGLFLPARRKSRDKKPSSPRGAGRFADDGPAVTDRSFPGCSRGPFWHTQRGWLWRDPAPPPRRPSPDSRFPQ